MMTNTSVVTVGSINIDLVVRAQRRPLAGETFVGDAFTVYPGGKGANQAVQVALSGVHSVMVGRMGDDLFAPLLRGLFDQCGVDHRFVSADAAGTGIGHVVVDAQGDYSTIIVARANGNLSPDDVDAAAPALRASRVLLLQLEAPLPTVAHAATLARRLGLLVVLNAAPALPLPPALLEQVDVLLVNEVEAHTLATGAAGAPTAASDWYLDALGSPRRDVVMTLGGRGVVARLRDGARLTLAAHKVAVTNTIGAGDAFAGELAAQLAQGRTLRDALAYANAAAALAVTTAAPQAMGVDRAQMQALLAQTDKTMEA